MIWLPLIAMPTLADPTAADQQVGAWAFVIVLLLVVGTFLLWFNMRKQIGKIKVPYAKEIEDEASKSDSKADGDAADAAASAEEKPGQV